MEKVTKYKLYRSAIDLYRIKVQLEQHLSRRTNELFDLEDKIILYNLTNTYFEGEKKKSQIVRFGRSKEKQNDARIIVLALVINAEGFIKYSDVFEGNLSDSSSLSWIVDKLRDCTAVFQKRAIVMMDAGIATDMILTKKESSAKNEHLHRVYFIRTSLKASSEETIWTIYNTIREIENTFRYLKTDLDLRLFIIKKMSLP